MATKHYLDDIPSSSERVYRIETNGNVSKITDVTEYEQKGSTFGADDVNRGCTLECDYEKVGNTHQLTTPNERSENIKFFATAPFNKGDAFTFNGKVVEVRASNGLSLCSNFFVANTIVECKKRDDVLYFTSSSESVVDDASGVEYRFGIENGMMYMEEV